jgi:hypothetical protein
MGVGAFSFAMRRPVASDQRCGYTDATSALNPTRGNGGLFTLSLADKARRKTIPQGRRLWNDDSLLDAMQLASTWPGVATSRLRLTR